MDQHELNRRDFNRLTMAAFGGVVAGTMSGCGDDKKPAATPPSAPAAAPSADKKSAPEVAEVKGEPHACRGLNACKNQGSSGKNDCAGQGECATASWHHTCGQQNACKGQGGCGPNATMNDCKGKGGCHIPLMDHAWETARKHFEKKMKEAGKEVGAAPAAK